MPPLSIENAMMHELPIYRRYMWPIRQPTYSSQLEKSIGRQEIYRVKMLLEQTVESFTSRARELSDKENFHFRRLLKLLTELQIEEYQDIAGVHESDDKLTCGALQ